MMDLHSFNTELRALRSITDSETKVQRRLSLLGRLTAGHFSNDITRSAFKRLSKCAQSESELPDWSDLSEDPRLTEEVKDVLREEGDTINPVDPAKYKALVARLTKYKTRRDLKDMAASIIKGLEQEDSDDFDEDTIRTQAAEKLSAVGCSTVDEAKIYGFGKGKKRDALRFVDQVLDSPAEALYRTGFTSYDERAGGLPTSGVVLLAGTTSGGKSVVSMNLGRDMAELNGIDVLRVTLEMTAEQETKRAIAMESGIEFSKIRKGELTDREKARARRAMQSMHDKLEKAGGSFSYVSPARGMSMDDVLHMSSSTGAHTVIIDYVGLLEGIDANNQAATLSEAVRKAKIHASNTGRLYILLVQLDTESGKVRYSRAMVEHADVLLTWSYTDPEVRDMHELPIEVAKSRDGELFEFALPEAFAVMATGARAASYSASGGERRESIRPASESGDEDEKPARKPKRKPQSSFQGGDRRPRREQPKKPRGSFDSAIGG